MKVNIADIKVAERIRKLTAKVDELAGDIRKNGLINPITLMEVGAGGGYQLLAGLRRLRAVQSLGWDEVEATVAQPKDAEAALNIEYSENMQREAFTYSEKMDYARLIDEIEKAKADERKSDGQVLGGNTAGKGRAKDDDSYEIARPHSYDAKPPRKQQVRDIVGNKIGMSGAQYDRAKYVASHATQEVMDELDRGERSISGTYFEMRGIANKPTTQTEPALVEPSAADTAPVSDLDRAIRAERELDSMKYRQHNEIFHRDSIIESLKNRVAELESALAEANARIKELENDN